MRAHAANCEDMAEKAPNTPAAARYRRLAEGWKAVSETQAWLEGEMPPLNQRKRHGKIHDESTLRRRIV